MCEQEIPCASQQGVPFVYKQTDACQTSPKLRRYLSESKDPFTDSPDICNTNHTNFSHNLQLFTTKTLYGGFVDKVALADVCLSPSILVSPHFGSPPIPPTLHANYCQSATTHRACARSCNQTCQKAVCVPGTSEQIADIVQVMCVLQLVALKYVALTCADACGSDMR